MASIDLTNGQENAIKRMEMWWKLTSSQQVFEISGWAGTGKSTIVYAAMEQLKLSIRDDVKFVAFTGKAALVLNLKGVPAVTIHKLIYDSIETNIPEMDSKGNPVTDSDGNTKYKTVTKFVKKSSLDVTIKLIVADECGMISEELWDDLRSFGIPIVVLGDPGQLPPIHGKSPLLINPDVMLTEIMRQKADNPIIHLSMLAREGKFIPYGKYGKRVMVIRKDEITDKMLKFSDVNIVGTNDTRDEMNNYIRYEILGRERKTPEKGDKVICRKNDWETVLDGIPMINGLVGYVKNPIDISNITEGCFKMDFRPEFMTDNYFENIDVNMAMFQADGNKARREIIQNRFAKGQKFEYAYAISTHLSQGSSFGKVLFYYEEFGDRTFRKQNKYTGITRSEDLLLLAQ